MDPVKLLFSDYVKKLLSEKRDYDAVRALKSIGMSENDVVRWLTFESGYSVDERQTRKDFNGCSF